MKRRKTSEKCSLVMYTKLMQTPKTYLQLRAIYLELPLKKALLSLFGGIEIFTGSNLVIGQALFDLLALFIFATVKVKVKTRSFLFLI
ncbi:hypothetical protein VCR26J2_460031 [Vibrio coralliirubri]|nr:hypothetical protein VCR26J2_460031 [Vibrio coralliirubri]